MFRVISPFVEILATNLIVLSSTFRGFFDVLELDSFLLFFLSFFSSPCIWIIGRNTAAVCRCSLGQRRRRRNERGSCRRSQNESSLGGRSSRREGARYVVGVYGSQHYPLRHGRANTESATTVPVPAVLCLGCCRLPGPSCVSDWCTRDR